MLLLDMEGSEYFALKHLISRPNLIVIEMQDAAKKYKNPYFDEILNWFTENKYQFKGTNNIEEDWYFEKRKDT